MNAPGAAMRRWEVVDRAPVPGSKSVLTLLRSGDALAIQVDGRPLMSSAEHRSEERLAELGCAHLADRRGGRVLVGGLGLGYTLAAALRRVGPEAEVVVAELVPGTVAWNRGPIGPLAGHPLDDPRVTVHVGDVADPMYRQAGTWDAILLDVDNGPGALTRSDNGWLYGAEGLGAALAALRPGGALAVWSAGPDDRFTARLERAGFAVQVVAARSRGHRHVVWVARSPPAGRDVVEPRRLR